MSRFAFKQKQQQLGQSEQKEIVIVCFYRLWAPKKQKPNSSHTAYRDTPHDARGFDRSEIRSTGEIIVIVATGITSASFLEHISMKTLSL